MNIEYKYRDHVDIPSAFVVEAWDLDRPELDDCVDDVVISKSAPARVTLRALNDLQKRIQS